MRFFGKKKEKDPYENLDFRAEMQLLQDEKDKAAKLANQAVNGMKDKVADATDQAEKAVNNVKDGASKMANDATSQVSDMKSNLGKIEDKIPSTNEMSNMASSISGMADNVPSMDDMSKNFPDGLSGVTNMLGINGNSDGSNENPLPSFEMNEDEKKEIETRINDFEQTMKEDFRLELNNYKYEINDNLLCKSYKANKNDKRFGEVKKETHEFIDTYLSGIIKNDEKDEIKKALINVIKNNLEIPIFKNKEEKKEEDPPQIEIVIGDPPKVSTEKLKEPIK